MRRHLREDWYRPQPGPICAVLPASALDGLVRRLRAAASRFDDAAWVHAQPPSKDGLATLSVDLLDASGVVGLRQPRSVGERHLLRVMPHWLHGPVAHVIVDEVDNLTPGSLDELQQAALVCGIQVWLIVDAAAGPHVTWARDHGYIHTADQVLAQWQTRPADAGCDAPDRDWWFTQSPLWPIAATTGCRTHASRVDCLLAWARRGLVAGYLSPGAIRARLIELLDHPATTVADRWALTAAGRDLYTPALDALGKLAVDAQDARIADVTEDGRQVTVAASAHAVPTQQWPPLARMRASRVLAGCLPDEPVLGIFQNAAGEGT